MVVRVLSLGAGVQSSTLALMAAVGEIEPPAFAVFADTRGEPQAVYTWLDWLETQLSFPVYRTSRGDLRADSLTTRISSKSGKRYWRSLIPTFIKKPDGKKGILIRKCTRDYKIDMIYREIIKRLGLTITQRRVICVEQLMGISTDEAHRQKLSKKSWARNRYPLIELGMSRTDCLTWMQAHGFPRPPRSACTFCPYHSDKEWANLKANAPQEFQQVVLFERQQQEVASQCQVIEGVPFLHVTLKPLDQVEFGDADPHAEFSSDCEGMCGV